MCLAQHSNEGKHQFCGYLFNKGIYNKNRGLRTEPCGTPYFTFVWPGPSRSFRWAVNWANYSSTIPTFFQSFQWEIMIYDCPRIWTIFEMFCKNTAYEVHMLYANLTSSVLVKKRTKPALYLLVNEVMLLCYGGLCDTFVGAEWISLKVIAASVWDFSEGRRHIYHQAKRFDAFFLAFPHKNTHSHIHFAA